MTVTIYPAAGEETATAQALLALADSPLEVATTTDLVDTGAHVAFIISDALGEKWLKRDGDDSTEDTPKRRGGRPRKAVAETAEDNDTAQAAEGSEGE